MNIGEMRHRVMLQTRDRTPDGQGGYIEGVWRDEIALWASIEPTVGSKKYEAAQMVQGVTHVITTHFVSNYGTNNRFTYGTRKFKVTGVTNVGERYKELQWMCEEKLHDYGHCDWH